MSTAERRWEYRGTTGSAFRLMREALELTRQQVAQEVGVAATTLGRIERDERPCGSWEPLYWRLVRLMANPPQRTA